LIDIACLAGPQGVEDLACGGVGDGAVADAHDQLRELGRIDRRLPDPDLLRVQAARVIRTTAESWWPSGS
jgi:hypothetical protein